MLKICSAHLASSRYEYLSFIISYVKRSIPGEAVKRRTRIMPWFPEYYLNAAYSPREGNSQWTPQISLRGQNEVMMCWSFCCPAFLLFFKPTTSKNCLNDKIIHKDGSQRSANKGMFYEHHF